MIDFIKFKYTLARIPNVTAMSTFKLL